MDYESIPGIGRDTDGEVSADQAQMAPELAAAAAAAARTGGAPLLPDANGVIVLPAGATLDDIAVVGRDLVITTASGEVFVIPNGAVDVPQIVVDGVAVPPLNLAALLIAGEQPIEPAAGNPRSSGNNFFEPAGPIQPGFDIGDLLPPTAFGFAAEPREEVIPQPLDREPTLVIVTPDQPAGAANATVGVAEAGLPARSGEPAGSNSAAASETTSGTIIFAAPDGIASLTINGVVLTDAGQTFVSPRGTLAITSFDPVTGTVGFSFTLTDNLVGGTVADQFAVVLTDRDGDVATSTLTVNVADDAPTARNDTDALAAGVFTAQTGNVITGAGTTSGAAGADTLGADNATITRIASNAIAANVDTGFDAAGNLQVAGQFGTLLIKADGSYSYVRAAGTPGGVSDAFTYTLTDSDGSASTAMLTIAIADAAPVITSVPTTGPGTVVNEAGLPARGGEAPGSNAPAPTETTSGTITFTGGDNPVTATINGTPVAVGVVITTSQGTLTVTAFDPNAGTIDYTFTLADNTTGDATNVSFNVVVTDVDGDAAPGTFTITIVDDAPDAIDDSATQSAENVPVTVDVLANDIQGADSVAFSAVTAVPGTLSGAGTLVYNNDGTFTYTPGPGEQGTVTFDYTITDGDGDSDRATVTITLLADSTPTVAVAGDNSVDEAALPARGGEPAGSNATSPDETAAGTISLTTGGDTLASLVINGVNVTNGGTVTTAKGVLTVSLSNGAYGYSYTLTDNTLADPDSDTFSVTVTDSDGDSASTSLVVAIADDNPSAADDAGSVAAGTFSPIGGNVLANDTPGADGIVVLSYAGVTTGNAGATIQGQYGTLSIAADGTYSYARNAGTPGGVSDAFTYTVRDGDGDLATANLVIAIADSGTTLELPIAGMPGVTQVLEEGLPAGSNAAGNGEFASGTFSFTAPDGPAIVTIGGTTITAVGQTITGSFGTLTITSIAAGSIGYSYQLTVNTSGDATFDSFAVSVADQDGDTTGGTLRIDIVDDVPTARPDADSVTEDGPLTADGNVITGAGGTDLNTTDGVADTRGADGASVSAVAVNPVAGGSVAGTVGTGLAGAYGTLTLNADGSYSYVLDNANPLVQGLDGNDALTETFAYTLTDGDGDPSPSTLTITINGANDGVTITGLAVAGGEETVFEDDLLDGSSPDMTELTQTGSFTVTAQDGIATIQVGGITVFSGGTVTTGMTFNAAFGTLTITSVTPTTDGAGDVTAATIGYSYTLNENTLTHATSGADSIFDSFAVAVSDTDGSTAVDSLDVKVVDDTPAANPDTNMVDEGALASGNVLTDGTDDVFGADGAASTTPAGGVVGVAAGTPAVAPTSGVGTPVVTALGTLTLHADGSYSYQARSNTNTTANDVFTYTIRDADGDISTTTLTIAVKDVTGTVSDVDVDVDESGLDATGSQFAPNGEFDTNGQITVTGATGTFAYTLTGGPAAPLGTLTLDTATGAYSYELMSAVDNATADDGRQVINGVESYGYQVTDQNGNLIGTGTIVVNVRDDVPTLTVSDTPTSATEGQTVDGAYSLTAGADGVSSVEVTFGTASQTLSLTPGSSVMLVQPTGTLVVRADGTFSFTAALDQDNDAMPAPAASFTIRATDGDGDTSMDSLTIAIQDGADAGDPTAVTLAVDERFLNTAAATGSTPGAGTVGDANPTLMFTAGSDSLTSFVFGDVSNLVTTLDGMGTDLFWSRASDTTITGSLTMGGPAAITLTLTAPASILPGQTGAVTVTFTLADNLPHELAMMAQTQGLGFVTVLARDNDGGVATGQVNLTVTDDLPTADADGPFLQPTENLSFTIDALDGDVFGADGVDTADPAKVFVSTQATQGVATYDPATGLFTYTPNSGAGGSSTSDSFQYTIVDGDGDVSTATVTITLQPDSTPVAVDAAAFLDDDGLAAGNPVSNPAMTDDDQDRAGETGAGVGDEAVFTGALTVSTGAADAPLTFSLASAAGSGLVGAENVNLAWDATTSTLTATVAALALDGVTAQARANTTLFTVKIDDVNTGAYTVTLLNPIAHATQDGTANDDTENNFSIDLTYTVTDSDTPTGDSDTGLLTIDFDDDTPSANSFSVTQPNENQAFTMDLTGEFDAGADGLASITFTNPSDGLLQLNGSTFTYTPNAGAGSNGDTTDSFTYTITDADGDSVTRTVSVMLQPDSTPMAGAATNLTVDEDGFVLTANLDNSTAVHPNEVDGGENLTDATGVVVVDFDNDAPTGPLLDSIVFINPGSLDNQLVTAAGLAVTFEFGSAGTDMRTLIGRDSNGAEAIRITLTGASGPVAGEVTYTYSTTLSQPVRHSSVNGENTIDLTGVTFQVTDRDGDPTTGSFKVTILDDVPGLDVTATNETGVVLATQDAQTAGNLSDMAVSTSNNFAGVFAALSTPGADDATTTPLSYALNVDDAMSGLFSGGQPITLLELNDGLVVGYTGVTAPTMETDASVVFSVKVAADGTVTLTQFRQLDHGTPEAMPDYDDDQRFLADGKLSLTATTTITDRDDDSATDSATVDLGGNLRFDDDGPSLSNVQAGAGVTIDETDAGADFATSPISAMSGAAVITFTPAFGADGPATMGDTVYGLTIVGGGATALQTAIGNFAIALVQDPLTPNVITGQYNDGAVKTAFTLTIGTDGRLTLQQFVALEHTLDGNTSAAFDDALLLTSDGTAMGASLVNATVTLKDFDNDTATQSVAIGGNVTFRDDGVDAMVDTGMVAAGSGAPIMGNVLANDYRGADGSAISGIVNTAAMTTGTLTAGEFTINGQFGTLSVNATTGAYTYDRFDGQGGGESDVFTYTLTDNDGDFDTATLTIEIGNLTPVAGVADATVDDDALGGNAMGVGDIDANNPPMRTADADQTTTEAVFKGFLGSGTPMSVNGDGTNTFLFTATQPMAAQTIGQETVAYSVSPDGSLLTATILSSPTGRMGTLFTVQITDPQTGAYTLTLMQPVLHDTRDGIMGDDTENDVDIALAYQLRDEDNDLSMVAGALSIRFDDDTPTAMDLSRTQPTENQAFTIDISGSFAAGADGLAAMGGIAFTQPTQGGSVSLTGTMFTYTPAPGADGTPAGPDDSFTYTITDADGDSVTRTVSISLQPDSAPMVVNVVAAVDDDGLANGNAGGAGDINANTFTDPDDLNGNPLGDPTSEASFRGQINANFGGDSGSVSFENLDTTDGFVGTERVIYRWDAGANTLTARVAADTGGMSPVAQARAGTDLFQVTLTPAGEYVVTLLDNVLHASGGNDETSAPVVDLFYRATDSDNDVVETGKLSITFNDDTPTQIQPEASSLTNNPTGFDTGFLSSNGLADNYGADGPGTVRFPGSLETTATGLTSGGQTIKYDVSDNGLVLTAYTGASLATGTVVFTATLTPGSNQYTIDMNGSVDSVIRVSLNPTSAGFVGGNDPWAGFNRTGPNDILLTPSGSGDQTLNTSNILLGVGGGNQVDFNEGVRIDFVTNLGGNPSGNGGYLVAGNRDHTFDSHYFTNGASVKLTQENGANVTANFKALDDTDTDTIVLNDGTAEPVTGITITYFGVTYADPITGDQIIVPTTTATPYTVNGRTFTVQLQGDGSVNVANIDGDNGNSGTGTEIAVFTADGYTSLVVSNVTATSSFKISGFGASVPTAAPVNLSLPVEIVDGDGDVVGGTSIAVTLNPGPVVLDLDSGGAQFLSLEAGVTHDYGAGAVGTAWAAPGDGILALDANASGGVDDASEFVFGGSGLTDLEALAARYGETLDANDADFARFGVWQDADSDGVADAGEFRSLGELGIVSIGLSSDGKAYAAAGGDVQVAGTAAFTRADGATGAVADAAFVTAPLARMAARTAEIAASNVAAAGVLAAAAASVTSLSVAAAETGQVSVDAGELPQAQSLQALPETQSSLEPLGEALLGDEPARAAQVEQASARHVEPSETRGNLADEGFEARSPLANDNGDAASTARFAAEAPSFAANDGGQLMEALLLAAQAGTAGDVAGQQTQDLAAVQEAFGDTHGAAMVDAVVAHFAGSDAAPSLGEAGEGALAALLGSTVAANDAAFVPFDFNTLMDDQSAAAAAQV